MRHPSRAGTRHALVGGVSLVLASGAGALPATALAAETCPNEQIRAQQTYASTLSDCRAYEQVSPVDKGLVDAQGAANLVQAAPTGNAVAYFSILPFPSVLLGAAAYPTYVSARNGGSWSTSGLLPEAEPEAVTSVRALTEDLSYTLIEAIPGLEPGVKPGEYAYVRDNVSGSLLAFASGKVYFAGATADDSRILFEDEAALLPNAVEGVSNLYEVNRASGRLELIAADAVAGPSGSFEGQPGGGSQRGFYTENAISQDGSRVFFTDLATQHIYVREPEADRTIEVSPGHADWRGATPDGSKTFYVEGERLYRFDVEHGTREELTKGAAGTVGTLGISNDGSYVYFVATAILSRTGVAEGGTVPGQANLYEWHDGVTTMVASGLALGSPNETGGDDPDWRAFYDGESEDYGVAGGGKGARVTPDGHTVLFSSVAQLTSYENAGEVELYVYDASDATLRCVSCNPSGAAATSGAKLVYREAGIGPPYRNAFLTRNLSENGKRVFFDSEEALVPQDTNGQLDVYEWEEEGEGSCPTGHSSGCIYLVSTGQSTSGSYFGDASADGGDVFFFTRQSLVGQDQDDNADVYDARVGGGIAAQSPLAAAPCVSEECHGVPGVAPQFAAPSSATFSGAGNLTPAPTSPVSKPARKSLTRAQQLAKALKACKKKPKKKRAVCKSQARKKYAKKASKAARVDEAVRTRQS